MNIQFKKESLSPICHQFCHIWLSESVMATGNFH